MKTINLIRAAAVAAVVSMSAVSNAQAGGFFGDLIEGACGGCGAGRALDRAHKELGNPLDRAGAAVAQSHGVPVSPYCATDVGVFVGPWLPIGVPCVVDGYQGVTVQ